MAPEPAQQPPPQLLVTDAAAAAPPPPEPFYKKLWFWGAVGVVVLTFTVITIASSDSSGPGVPNTTFGNMHAF